MMKWVWTPSSSFRNFSIIFEVLGRNQVVIYSHLMVFSNDNTQKCDDEIH